MSSPAAPLLCRRDAEGRIVALTRQALSEDEARAGGWEAAPAGDPAVDHFLRGVASETNPLSLTDAGMGRVTEDLIDVLIDRGVIQFTDLPVAAQAKLLQRRQTRAQLAHRLKLLADEGDERDDGLI
ncbi:hypothetical protein [Ramlibacter sp. 2FC]|uniref:hypothetical protein n=1 Tax=Ramlibacter sp. 2FC TaxID=2502188 RepID=UPI00201D2F3C|nr:hypothetical protein [Ramlibacter sp. 2FC]